MSSSLCGRTHWIKCIKYATGSQQFRATFVNLKHVVKIEQVLNSNQRTDHYRLEFDPRVEQCTMTADEFEPVDDIAIKLLP